ncbi:MAG: hypothetical protein N2171_01155 [Clostridia bacterium]|nr:hypothetical protein [Clostridia bacterium]
MIVLVIIAFALIAWLDVPKLINRKEWKDLIVFSIFYIFAFIIASLQAFKVEIPSPILGIQFFIEKILHLSYG